MKYRALTAAEVAVITAKAPKGNTTKTHWDPCCVCGDPDGAMSGHLKTPIRRDISLLSIKGLTGWACVKCFTRVGRRVLKTPDASLAELTKPVEKGGGRPRKIVK